MSQLNNLSSASIGRMGLMTAGPGTDTPLDICRVATNAVIERSGRVSARQAFNTVTPSAGSYGANVRSLHETIRKDGSIEIISADDTGFGIYTKSTGAFTALAGVAASVDGHWQFTNADNQMLAGRVGSVLQCWQRDGSGNWASLAIVPKASWADNKYSVVHTAFGRAWVANRSDEKSIVYGSVLLDIHDFNGASSGTIDLNSVWANGQDEVVAISSHANFLVIIGKTQTVLYTMPADLSIGGMVLHEVIKNVGCVSKYTVVNTGNDLVWLSQQGVVSLGRLTQVTNLPIGNISKNVHFDLISKMIGYTDLTTTRAMYQRDMQNYLLFFGDTTAYCFSMRQRSDEDGAALATTWDALPATYGCVFTRDGTFYTSGATGLMLYSGYNSTAFPYNMEWASGYNDFGDPSILKFLKKLHFRALGASSQIMNFRWSWDFRTDYQSASATIETTGAALSEWNIAEWGLGEFSVGAQVGTCHVPASGSGTILQIGLSAPVNGSELTFYSLDVMVTTGKRTGST